MQKIALLRPYMRRYFNSIQLAALRTTGWADVRAGRGMTGALLESRQPPAGADLKRLYVATMLEWIDAGWQLGEFSSISAHFFCARDVERRMVSIQPTDSEKPLSGGGGSHLQECQSCGQ